MKTPSFPLKIFYDGACPVCSREVEHYRRQDRSGRLQAIDISAPEFDPKVYGIPFQDFMYQLHVIDADGEVYLGVDAFRAIWRAFPDSLVYRTMARILALPVMNPLARVGYRIFARLRPRLPGRDRACSKGSCQTGDGGES
ncbi:MAG: DUF393 domain-containing protein [Desulfuromonas sp.]|nr:MAG: DUF393 domain-containing protein [Desulfuromonas sp.]